MGDTHTGTVSADVGGIQITSNTAKTQKDLIATVKGASAEGENAPKGAEKGKPPKPQRGARAKSAPAQEAPPAEGAEATPEAAPPAEESKPEARDVRAENEEKSPEERAKDQAEFAKKQMEAEGEEAKEAAPEEKPEEPPKKRKNDPNVRIRELVRQRNEARAQLQEMQRAQEAAQPPPQAPQAPQNGNGEAPHHPYAQPGMPSLDDYPDVPSWLEARDQVRDQRIVEQVMQAVDSRDAVQRENAQIDGWRGDLAEAFSNTEGFDLRALPEELQTLRPTFELGPDEVPTAENLIATELALESSEAPAVLSYLGENLDEFQRIAALPTPRDIVSEMAILRYKLRNATAGTEPQPQAPTVSQAPPPISPVTGAPASAAPKTPDPAKMDFAKYASIRMKEIRAQKRNRGRR